MVENRYRKSDAAWAADLLSVLTENPSTPAVVVTALVTAVTAALTARDELSRVVSDLGGTLGLPTVRPSDVGVMQLAIARLKNQVSDRKASGRRVVAKLSKTGGKTRTYRMSAAKRKAQSRRMRAYWQARREATVPVQPEPEPESGASNA